MSTYLNFAVCIVYVALVLSYLAKEVYLWKKIRTFNFPKNLLIFGTSLSWATGIIFTNNDLAFTITNVVSHGIPYMSLVWIYGHQKTTGSLFFSKRAIPIFLLIPLVFAYVEEGLWDGFIWRDHTKVFSFFTKLPHLTSLVPAHSVLLTLFIPFLALPQATHYIIDGFLWKRKAMQ